MHEYKFLLDVDFDYKKVGDVSRRDVGLFASVVVSPVKNLPKVAKKHLLVEDHKIVVVSNN